MDGEWVISSKWNGGRQVFVRQCLSRQKAVILRSKYEMALKHMKDCLPHLADPDFERETK